MLIIVAGLLLAGVAYGCLYMTRTAQARRANAAEHPELVWLKREFGLSQQEFARIRNLHEAYLPDCARMCAKIEAANTELEALVLKTNQVTPRNFGEAFRHRQDSPGMPNPDAESLLRRQPFNAGGAGPPVLGSNAEAHVIVEHAT